MTLFRVEVDFLGEAQIPVSSYWGAHTARAMQNFPITDDPVSNYPALIIALAQIKLAAARANHKLGKLPEVKLRLISAACEELIAGRLHDQFPIDLIQGGAGTSTNMNANEVIANRGLEFAGKARGSYADLHPNDDVNHAQSTNDVYPSAIKIALYSMAAQLFSATERMISELRSKAREFESIVKIGRTQLQDAVPLTLGQEFDAFANSLAADLHRLRQALEGLLEVNLGGTAIGTGITTSPGYQELVISELNDITGLPIYAAEDLIAATSDMSSFVQYSGALKTLALKLSKISNDLRLLSSGPQAGIQEINLPPRQAGSSIMPGKVNPVIPEVVSQVAFAVAGFDTTVSFAAEAGQMQLNAFEPVIAQALFNSTTWLENAVHTLRDNCVQGITANEAHLAHTVAHSVALVTALTSEIGYDRASKIAATALKTGQSIREIVLSENLITADRLEELLQPERLTQAN